jgi:hypothetical protein
MSFPVTSLSANVPANCVVVHSRQEYSTRRKGKTLRGQHHSRNKIKNLGICPTQFQAAVVANTSLTKEKQGVNTRSITLHSGTKVSIMFKIINYYSLILITRATISKPLTKSHSEKISHFIIF